MLYAGQAIKHFNRLNIGAVHFHRNVHNLECRTGTIDVVDADGVLPRRHVETGESIGSRRLQFVCFEELHGFARYCRITVSDMNGYRGIRFRGHDTFRAGWKDGTNQEWNNQKRESSEHVLHLKPDSTT